MLRTGGLRTITGLAGSGKSHVTTEIILCLAMVLLENGLTLERAANDIFEVAFALCASGNNTAVSIVSRALERYLGTIRETSTAFRQAFPEEVDDCDIQRVTMRVSHVLRILQACFKTPVDVFSETVVAQKQLGKA